MLTISQLARYAGVTVSAVRHYHKIGLLPEPERDRSGYRSYDASTVVQLIRIHILASAGVPLSRVRDLLDATPAEFADSVQQIDTRLRGEIRKLQRARKRLASLAAGEQLALPATVVRYLDRLRDLGVAEHYIDMERDAWIMLAVQVPDQIDAIIARKQEDLGDPDMRRLYELVSQAATSSPDDAHVVEAADIVDRLFTRAMQSDSLNVPGLDDGFVDLLDATLISSAPSARRMMALLEDRGWKGWNRIERVPTDNPDASSSPAER